jgi:hypothetical protein
MRRSDSLIWLPRTNEMVSGKLGAVQTPPLLLSEGRMSDDRGAALLVDALPRAKELLQSVAMVQTGFVMH